MREFQDEGGQSWVASVAERPGDDYKGRYFLLLRTQDEGEGKGGEVTLDDVRWNTVKTAERTLKTMSEVELKRRLRWARGRA
jgi:hypothetical protein